MKNNYVSLPDYPRGGFWKEFFRNHFGNWFAQGFDHSLKKQVYAVSAYVAIFAPWALVAMRVATTGAEILTYYATIVGIFGGIYTGAKLAEGRPSFSPPAVGVKNPFKR